MASPTRLFSGTCEISTGAFTPSGTPPAYQGEAQAIKVQVAFTQGGASYDIPSDVTVYRYLYYDAQGAHTTARSMDKVGNTASALLTEQEQGLPGIPYLCVTMVDGAGIKLVSFATRIEIQRLLGKTLINTLSPEALEAAITAANVATATANLAAGRAELAAQNPPIPTEDNTWAVWDAETSGYIDTGEPSALVGPMGPQGVKGDTGDPTSSTAVDILTNSPGVSVQDALDDHAAQGEKLEQMISDAIATATRQALEADNPVGCIRMQTVATNPAALLGFGTWTAWGTGRVPVGVDTSQTEFNTVQKTGGAKTHALTASEGPTHRHDFEYSKDSGTTYTVNDVFGQQGGYDGTIGGLYPDVRAFAEWRGRIANSGSGAAHNNLQPYITCYMFVRTV